MGSSMPTPWKPAERLCKSRVPNHEIYLHRRLGPQARAGSLCYGIVVARRPLAAAQDGRCIEPALRLSEELVCWRHCTPSDDAPPERPALETSGRDRREIAFMDRRHLGARQMSRQRVGI